MNSSRTLFIPLALTFTLGLLIAALHTWLASRIEAQQRNASEAIYFDVLQLRVDTAQLDPSRVTDDASLLGLRAPQRIYVARQENRTVGVVLPLTAREGYSGDIDLLLGIDTSGKIISVRVVSQHETRDLGDKIERGPLDHKNGKWLDQFHKATFDEAQKTQWQLRSEGGAFDAITGATVTSRAVIKALQQGLDYFAMHRDELLEEQRHE